MCGKTKTTPASFFVRHPTGVPSSGSVQGTNTLLFPWKLHDMLQTVERDGQDDVVSWLPDGKSFKVHDTNTFVNEIMPKHFKQTKYKSFQRQLNLWGFKRITKSNGPDKGAYSHPQFLKGQKSLCRHLCRQNNASNNSSSSASNNNNSVSAAAIKKVVAKKTTSAKPRSSPAVVKRATKTARVAQRPVAMPVVEDTTHCSLLEMSIPTMMDLSTNEALFPSLSQGPQDYSSKAPATVVESEDSPSDALLFEGCKFFLLEELMSEEEWMEQEVKQTIAPPPSAIATTHAATTTSFNESISMVTPPSSPPHSQQDDEETSFDTDSLLPSICVA